MLFSCFIRVTCLLSRECHRGGFPRVGGLLDGFGDSRGVPADRQPSLFRARRRTFLTTTAFSAGFVLPWSRFIPDPLLSGFITSRFCRLSSSLLSVVPARSSIAAATGLAPQLGGTMRESVPLCRLLFLLPAFFPRGDKNVVRASRVFFSLSFVLSLRLGARFSRLSRARRLRSLVEVSRASRGSDLSRRAPGVKYSIPLFRNRSKYAIKFICAGLLEIEA